MRDWLGRAWRLVIVLVLIAAVAIPIYAGATDGFGGFIAGVYLGVYFAVAGLVMMAVTFAVDGWRRGETPPKPRRSSLPQARVLPPRGDHGE